MRDIVGLYLNPPEAAVMLCVDEKSQIQALDRSTPILPLMPGVLERRSHDYVRYGTTNLYAALDVGSGQVFRSGELTGSIGIAGGCDATGPSRSPYAAPPEDANTIFAP